MADFKVQRGTTQIAATNTTATISAGVDYTAPASASNAFCLIQSSTRLGGGVDGDNSPNADDTAVYLSNGGNITTSLTFERGASTGDVLVAWEIIEYIGSGGGANEISVLGHQQMSLTASTDQTADGSTLSPTDDNDVVVFFTGAKTDATGATDTNDAMCTTEWVAASNVARVTRIGTSGNVDASVAVVEFTGSNWNIDRVAHSFTSAGVTETETISISDVSKTFLHNQFRNNNGGLDEQTCECWVNSTTQVGFALESGAATGASEAVAWVIENTQASGDVMNVAQYTGTWTGASTGNPSTTSVSITTLSDTTIASIGSTSGTSTGTGSAVGRAHVNARITGTTTVELRKPEDAQDWTYNFEVVEWPSVGGGGGPVIPIFAHHYRTMAA